MEETSIKQTAFQKPLEMKNDQISELQDKETSGDHLAMMTSMSGFKFAVSFLFNSATEAMARATRRAREVTVLSIL